MKNRKKIFALLTLVAISLTTACSNTDTNTQNSQSSVAETSTEENKASEKEKQTTKIKILITDTVNNKEVLTEDIALKETENLQKYLEENHGAVFENGMMTELEGISQDSEKNQYWMYYVNDKMAEVGIGDYEAKENDKVEFKFEQM